MKVLFKPLNPSDITKIKEGLRKIERNFQVWKNKIRIMWYEKINLSTNE